MPKIKIYLDTNMVLDFFINEARHARLGGDLIMPKKFQFLEQNIDKVDFITSFLTEAEVIRELVAGLKMDERFTHAVWERFVSSLSCKHIDRYEFDRSIVHIVAKVPLKLRTMVNFFHLFIAIKEVAYFVTGDKDLVDKARSLGLYDKVISYTELRQLLS